MFGKDHHRQKLLKKHDSVFNLTPSKEGEGKGEWEREGEGVYFTHSQLLLLLLLQ